MTASQTSPSPARVIITGADSTARVIAETFLSDGHAVSVCDVRQEAVEDISAANPSIFAQTANMGVEAQVMGFMAAAIEAMGGVDFLVNVVGIAGPTKPTEEITSDEWAQSMAVNATGPFLACKAVIPHLKEQRFGGIVNFSSASTRTRLPNRTPYVVSKYAVEGLTLNLARELGPFNVRANAILPGGINNARLQTIVQKVAEQNNTTIEAVADDFLKYVSMQTLIEPAELADMVAFLCSDKAIHITGQLMAVDGNVEWEY